MNVIKFELDDLVDETVNLYKLDKEDAVTAVTKMMKDYDMTDIPSYVLEELMWDYI